MTASFIGSASNGLQVTSSGLTASTSVLQHGSTLVGDLLILTVAFNDRAASGNPGIGTPSGWLERIDSGVLDAGTSSATREKVFYREAATAGAASHTVNFTTAANQSGNHVSWHMQTWRGHRSIANGGPFSGDDFSVDDTATVAAANRAVECPSVSPAGDGGVIVCICETAGTLGSGADAWTPPSGMTTAGNVNLASGQFIAIGAAYLARTTGATGARTGTLDIDTSASNFYSHEVGVTLVLAEPNLAPTSATPLYPDGGITVPFDEPTACTWLFNDPDSGDYQSKADFRHRLVGAGSWTTILTAVTLSDTYLIPASTYADGDDVEWQVLTYDAAGEVAADWSPSAFFTAGLTPAAPTITSHSNDDIIGSSTATLTWTGSGDEFQVRKVGDDGAGSPDTATVFFDTGWVVEPGVLSYGLTFPVNDRTEHLQVRRKVSGLASGWASVRVSVSYTPPMAPDVTVTVHQVDGVDAALLVTVSNP